jgi:hypothetical protein
VWGLNVTLRTQRIGVSTVFAVHGAVMGTFATRIPAISEHLHLSPGRLGLALFAPAVGSLLAMPFTGGLMHRFGAKTATHVLIVLWCASLMLPAFATSLGWLAAALLVYGATAGMTDIAMNAQGVALEGRMGKSIMSSLHGMWSLGGFAAAGVGSLAAHANVSVRTHFVGVSIALIVLGTIATALLAPAAAEPDAQRDGADKPKRFAIPTGIVLAIGMVAFCSVFAELSGSDWAAVYLRRVLDASHGTAAFGYAVFAASMALARLTGDKVINALGPVRTVRLGAILGTAGAALVTAAFGQVLTIVGFGMVGVGIAVVVPLAFAAAGRIGAAGSSGGTAGASTGNAIAGVATIAYGAGLAAPGAIGGLATLTNLRVSFVMITVLVAVVVVTAGVLRYRTTDSPALAPATEVEAQLPGIPA